MVDPLLMSIATALATRAADGLADLVRSAFRRHPSAARALDAAQGAAPDSPQVQALATRLAEVEAEDPEFADRLRTAWADVQITQRADHGGVINQITGNVTGKVVQAGDIHGNITF